MSGLARTPRKPPVRSLISFSVEDPEASGDWIDTSAIERRLAHEVEINRVREFDVGRTRVWFTSAAGSYARGLVRAIEAMLPDSWRRSAE